jgi:plastocyanin
MMMKKMQRHLNVSNLFILVLLLLVIPLSVRSSQQSQQFVDHAQGVTQGQVSIANNQFSPKTLNISSGATVTWTNNDGVTHTTTSDNGSATSWDSNNLSQGGVFTQTFTAPGTYTYHCNIHGNMKGTIVVAAAAAQPTSAPLPPTDVPAAPEPSPTFSCLGGCPTPTVEQAPSPDPVAQDPVVQDPVVPDPGSDIPAGEPPVAQPSVDTSGGLLAIIVQLLILLIKLFGF